MKLTETKLRKVVRYLINEDMSDDLDYGEFDLDPGQEGHPEAPGAIATAVDLSNIDNRGGSKLSIMLDAWKAAGGVWRFSEAMRLYRSLNRESRQGGSVNYTLSRILWSNGRPVYDRDGNKAWALKGSRAERILEPRRGVYRGPGTGTGRGM